MYYFVQSAADPRWPLSLVIGGSLFLVSFVFMSGSYHHPLFVLQKNFDTNFDTKMISDHITFVDNALFVSKFVLKFFYF